MDDVGGDYMVGKENIGLTLDHTERLANQCRDSRLVGLRLVRWQH
jgi:hypothetical protein